MSSLASYMPANTLPDRDPRFENALPDDVIDMSNNGAGVYGGGRQSSMTTQQQQYRSSNNPAKQQPKKFRLKISQRLHWTSILAFISYLILTISFASPYWLSSYKFTDSAFKRLGLWDFCFQDYRHPSYQYDTKFTGCHWIYSPIYTNIRDWLQPAWFIFVQATMTMALCVSTIGLMAVSIVFMHFLIQYQLIILCVTLVCQLLTTLLLFFALSTFYLKAFDRGWIMYPEFNHVDWAFFFAFVSMFCNAFASWLYYEEVKTVKSRLLAVRRLVTSKVGRHEGANDLDSVDQVYSGRSPVYSQSLGQNLEDSSNTQRQAGKAGDAGLMYPHFTQV